MQITEISCDQFSGLHDRKYTFRPGMNLVIGDNESGKSTVVDLSYHMLFQDTNLDDRQKRHKEFKDQYFPKTTGSHKGDTIDGTIRFETEQGTYELKKEWHGKIGSIRLKTPEGTILRDKDTIHEILSEVLEYGKGVYNEFVFASQRRKPSFLRALLGKGAAESEGMEELSSAVTKAVMETGGIDIDRMEKDLKNTISGYEAHWDIAADMPEGGPKRGVNNPWKKDVGSILEAYYKKERILAERQRARSVEQEVDRINELLRTCRAELDLLRSKQTAFSKERSRIAERNQNLAYMKIAEKELEERRKALSDWPRLLRDLQRARTLGEELLLAKKKALYDVVNDLILSRDTLENQLELLGEIPAEDVKRAAELERRIIILESKLKGLHLAASIRRLGTAPVMINSAVSGEPVALEGDVLDIT